MSKYAEKLNELSDAKQKSTLSILQVERIVDELPEDVRLLAAKKDFILLGHYEDDELESAVVCQVEEDYVDFGYPGLILMDLNNEFLNSEHFLQIAELAFKSVVDK